MYDLAIIGAGAAGIAAAKLALAHGLKTVLFEQGIETFGGTCLNNGCVPTKFFINNAKVTKDWETVAAQLHPQVINKIKSPLYQFFQKSGIDIIFSSVSFSDSHNLRAGNKDISAKNIIIASGSLPRKIIEHPKSLFAEELLNLPALNDKYLVIGAGYIGIEIACLLNAFGRQVHVVEKEHSILPFFDENLSSRLRVSLERKGIKITTSTAANQDNFDDYDGIITSIGRVPNTAELLLSNAAITVNAHGWIQTDQYMRTNIDHIYACGDVTGKKLLAYTAEHQAEVCIKNILGQSAIEDYWGIAECVFSTPQLARVGLSQEQAKEKNINYRIIKSNFLKFSSSYVYNDIDGFIQVLVDDQDKIIGAGVISNFAGELISLFSLAVRLGLTVKQLAECVFVHPTISEIIPLLLKAGS